jgi:hypothetical protein
MKQKKPSTIIDPQKYGISFSLKQCSAFSIDQKDALRWLLNDAGFRRFRLMSYWNEHETAPGVYNFTKLDEQIDIIEKAGGEISLCLGARQPRWPENHWPDWILKESKDARTADLLKYIELVVNRYKDRKAITSYQLENEALLKRFGRNAEVDRKRLNTEYRLIQKLDPSRPIIMSTSNGWGIPFRRPIPDTVGFSYYFKIHSHGRYHDTLQKPWLQRFRKKIIGRLWKRPVFIHELQCEPWGPTAIWKMSLEEQAKSMSPPQIQYNIRMARSVGVFPIDLWGAEWWYWRLKKHDDPTIWKAVKDAIESNS